MTSYIDIWRANLKANLLEFATLIEKDPAINPIYGITAAAVLWGVRNAPLDNAQLEALKTACGDDDKHLHLLKQVLIGWNTSTPLEAAYNLNKRQNLNNDLRVALATVMGYFVETLLAENMLQTNITIEGDVTGANVVIGGHQIIAGNLIVQNIAKEKIRVCPTAPKPPAHFSGRRVEIERLKSLLQEGKNTALTGIQGMGGIGKTALAQKLATELVEFSAVLWGAVGQTLYGGKTQSSGRFPLSARHDLLTRRRRSPC